MNFFYFWLKNWVSGYGLCPKPPQSLKVLYLIPWLSMVLLLLSHTRLCNLNYLLDNVFLRGWTCMILRPLIFCSPRSFPLYLMKDRFFSQSFLPKMYRKYLENGNSRPALHWSQRNWALKNTLCRRQCFSQSCHCF